MKPYSAPFSVRYIFTSVNRLASGETVHKAWTYFVCSQKCLCQDQNACFKKHTKVVNKRLSFLPKTEVFFFLFFRSNCIFLTKSCSWFIFRMKNFTADSRKYCKCLFFSLNYERSFRKIRAHFRETVVKLYRPENWAKYSFTSPHRWDWWNLPLLVFDEYLIWFWWVFDPILIWFWLVFDEYLIRFCWVFDPYLTLYEYLIRIWWVFDPILMSIWSVLMRIWSDFDEYLIRICWVFYPFLSELPPWS